MVEKNQQPRLAPALAFGRLYPLCSLHPPSPIPQLRFPSWIVRGDGFAGAIWKAARVGERKSEWVGAACVLSGLAALAG